MNWRIHEQKNKTQSQKTEVPEWKEIASDINEIFMAGAKTCMVGRFSGNRERVMPNIQLMVLS